MERKRGRIRRVRYWKTVVAILAALSTSLAVADDFKTTNGKEYKNATVTRVEPVARRRDHTRGRHHQCAARLHSGDLKSFGLRLRVGLYGVGDGAGRVLCTAPWLVRCCVDVVAVGCVVVVVDPCS